MLTVADLKKVEAWKYYPNAWFLWKPTRVLRCHRICTSKHLPQIPFALWLLVTLALISKIVAHWNVHYYVQLADEWQDLCILKNASFIS